jgi:hypothetical protein
VVIGTCDLATFELEDDTWVGGLVGARSSDGGHGDTTSIGSTCSHGSSNSVGCGRLSSSNTTYRLALAAAAP